MTYLPPSCSEDEVVAFDTGPGNMVVDKLINIFTKGRASYDIDGSIASKGIVDKDLLEELLEDPYFSKRPPKSTGREAFGTELCGKVDLNSKGEKDLVATATMLTVETIARSYEDFVLRAGL